MLQNIREEKPPSSIGLIFRIIILRSREVDQWPGFLGQNLVSTCQENLATLQDLALQISSIQT